MNKIDEIDRIAGISARKFILRNGGEFDDAKSEVVVFLLSLGDVNFAGRQAYYIRAGYNRLVDNLRRERKTQRRSPPRFVDLPEVATLELPERALQIREESAIKFRVVFQTLRTFGKKLWRRDRQIVRLWLKGSRQTVLAKKYGVSKQRINQIIKAFRRAVFSNLPE